MAREHEKISAEALAEDPWALAQRSAAAGDQPATTRWLLAGLQDVTATLRTGVNVLERARTVCEEKWGSHVWGEVTRRAPIDPASADRHHVEQALEQLASAIEKFRIAPEDPDAGVEMGAGIDSALSAVGGVHADVYDFIALALTVVAETKGEDEVPVMWRAVLGERTGVRAAEQRSLPDRIRAMNRVFRAHFGGAISIEDQPDRVVVTHSMCGTGGRMRHEGGFGGAVKFGSTQRPHPWSWNRSEVPYYCVHCCLMWELEPVGSGRDPVRIHEGMDDASSPSVQHVYFKAGVETPAAYTDRVQPESS